MNAYQEAFKGLNGAQKEAVTTIDGPVLVIAGPGTGKTQLLGVRVAHILTVTDTAPQNILCLTFTENGAENMRERLTRFIGKEAYDVTISTYHAFGSELIRRYPEVFAETRLQTPADELVKHQILKEIVEGLSYKNPLKQLRYHLGDLIATISEVKRALLDSPALKEIASENNTFIVFATSEVQTLMARIGKMPGSAAKALPIFEPLLESLKKLVPNKPANTHFGSLASLAVADLEAAIAAAQESNKSTPLTKWKNTWLAKNADDQFIFAGSLENKRIEALAEVFGQYQAALEKRGLYDFDDMILRSIAALEKNPDLRFTLQEQYLYMLLDEFQDTNAAQLRLIQLLSDSPVHEGRPNVLAVGDDDQAIYAFQGAQYSNMLDFYQMYRDTKVINLVENYRSSKDVVFTAKNIAGQIEARLENNFKNITKQLIAANKQLADKHGITRQEFQSDVAQYDWIAKQIKQLIEDGTSPSEIAVLAPKHRQLEPLVPYLADLGVPMRYEKRENILEAKVIQELITMSRLVLYLRSGDEQAANHLWPEVLSFDFWNIPTSELWQLSWHISDSKEEGEISWSRKLLVSEKPYFRSAALLMLALAEKAATETCEQMLDYLIGSEPIIVKEMDLATVRSPLRAFYTGAEVQRTNPELFYDTISHLTVLRAKLRDFEATREGAFLLEDLLTLVNTYNDAEQQLLNTSPYNQQADAVQIMTVFKAKGLEFEHVFLPSCQDEVWGGSTRGNSNKLTLPQNLAPIRHAGATNDERLRILFVAVTRAKYGLYLTSFVRTYSGKNTKRLRYLDEREAPEGGLYSTVLPEKHKIVRMSDHTAPTLASLELSWRKRHSDARAQADLRSLLLPRLSKYQLSPTHLTHFIDLEYGGPEAFFFKNLLRFPDAPTPNSQFGNSIHETLEWIQHRTNERGTAPTYAEALHIFTTHLQQARLNPAQRALEQERGEKALKAYLTKRAHIFKPGDKAEHNFWREGVFIGDAHLAGKVDRMEIDTKNRLITVVDYKTGKSHARWSSESRLHKYALQLYCYKILIEGSHSFREYTVNSGRIEFIEPDNEGNIHHLELLFSEPELERVKNLLRALWQRVHALDFPDIGSYEKGLAGIKQFEDDLLKDLHI